jgi:hypothetical protein
MGHTEPRWVRGLKEIGNNRACLRVACNSVLVAVDLDVFPCHESWEMIESSHILYRESVL